jgi:hypothetical protein
MINMMKSNFSIWWSTEFANITEYQCKIWSDDSTFSNRHSNEQKTSFLAIHHLQYLQSCRE